MLVEFVAGVQTATTVPLRYVLVLVLPAVGMLVQRYVWLLVIQTAGGAVVVEVASVALLRTTFLRSRD